jgi:hypothetical protein
MKNYVTKLIRETKKIRNYVTFCQIQIQKVKTRVLYYGKYST